MYKGNTYYPNNGYYINPSNAQYNNKDQDRLIGGGFLAPFVLGGITGGLVAPYFYRPYPYYPPRPPMGPYPYYPRYW